LGEIQTGRGGRLAALAVILGALAFMLAAPAGAFHTKNPSLPPGPRDAGSPGFEGTDYQGFDPMETSIPYLAWRGEEVRLVKCFSPRDIELGPLATAEWQVMDWSGDPHVWPKFFDDLDQETGWADGFGDQDGRQCFAIDITSHKPGIAIVKMSIDGDDVNLLDDTITPLDPGGNALVGEGDPTAKHQFVVIWMTLDTPILRCLAADTSVSPSGCPGAGPVTENPNDTNRLGVLVKGLVPLNEQFRTELGAQDSDLNASQIKFPDIWDDLARTSLSSISRGLFLANNGNPNDDPVNPQNVPPERDLVSDQVYDEFWDIHDSTGPFNSGVYGPDQPERVTDICPGAQAANHLSGNLCHVSQGVAGDNGCSGNAPLNDTVDNCNRGEFAAFSRVFHDTSGPPTIGPYAPTRPDETMLSDSVTNINDAPMPAALVKASIAPNSGAPGDISGVGFLSEVDKHLVSEYNRGGPNCTGTNPPDSPHCLTAPFYGAYIPPSPTMENNPALDDDRDVASGIHGSFANNFEGYLPVHYPRDNGNLGLYHYWDIVETRRTAEASETDCFDPRDPEGDGRPTPSGPQEIVLYTDEHGEAQFQFNAGLGFFFDEFIVDPTQRTCLPEGLLGTADISVQARYPFQPLTNAGTTSNTLQKRIQSLFRKGIICVPKPGEEEDKILCVVFGRDIDGEPILDEEVCVTAVGGTLVRTFIGSHETRRLGDTTACGDLHENNDEMEDLGTDLFPTIDDSFGIETFLIIGRGPIRVIADFVDERLEIETNVPVPPPTTTTTAQQPPAPPPPQLLPPPPPPQVLPPPAPPIVLTVPQATQQTTTQRAPTTVRRPVTTVKKVKAKRKITVKKKVKKVKRQSACIIRGRVVRPCVRGKG
jgi:hypothetical protein